MIKGSMGLLLAFLIGVGCRFFNVPIPGPLSMTTGYVAVDKVTRQQRSCSRQKPRDDAKGTRRTNWRNSRRRC